MKFKEFIAEQTDFQKKDFSVKYGRNDVVTKLTHKGKHISMIMMSVLLNGKIEKFLFEYSKSEGVYIHSRFRGHRDDLMLFKKMWNNVKEVNNVRF